MIKCHEFVTVLFLVKNGLNDRTLIPTVEHDDDNYDVPITGDHSNQDLRST